MTPNRRHPVRPARRAFTLVEAILAIVIVSVMAVAILYTFGSGAKGRSVQTAAAVADGLAARLLSEIIQTRYSNPDGPNTFGPETAEINGTRSAFDDVDDYHGWTESPPKKKDGSTLPGLTGWQRSVTVENVDPATLAPAGATDTGLKRITVTVTDPQGRTTPMTALRSSAGTYDQPAPASPTTYVAWVGVTLQIGSDSSARILSGTYTPSLVP